MFSPFRSLRSLSKPGMYLFFSFWQIAVTFGSGSVSFFLLLADCSHFRIPECIFFLLFAVCGHFLAPGVHLFFSFWQIAVTFGSGSVSFFLLFAVCGHFRNRECIFFSPFRSLQSFWNPGVYLIFSFSQSAVTLVPKNSAESLPNKKQQQKTIFSFDAAVFRQ